MAKMSLFRRLTGLSLRVRVRSSDSEIPLRAELLLMHIGYDASWVHAQLGVDSKYNGEIMLYIYLYIGSTLESARRNWKLAE